MPSQVAARSIFLRHGLALSVEEQSADSGGERTPVLFQHGLCGDANQTREAFPSLSNYRRLTLECRGHGQSEAGSPSEFSIATFTDDVIAFLEQLGQGPAVVGGISMGAAIALRLAATRPDLVRAMILVRPAWVTASAPGNMQPNAQVGALLKTNAPHAPQGCEQAHSQFLLSDTAIHLAQVAPDNLRSLESFFDRKPVEITAQLLTRISADGPGIEEDDLLTLKTPTLILGHDQDFIHPLAHARALAQLLPNSELRIITAKATSKQSYLADMHQAIEQFLQELPI